MRRIGGQASAPIRAYAVRVPCEHLIDKKCHDERALRDYFKVTSTCLWGLTLIPNGYCPQANLDLGFAQPAVRLDDFTPRAGESGEGRSSTFKSVLGNYGRQLRLQASGRQGSVQLGDTRKRCIDRFFGGE